MERMNIRIQLVRAVTKIQERPFVTTAFVVIFTTLISNLFNYFSPFLVCTALCTVIAIVNFATAERAVKLERQKESSGSNARGSCCCCASIDRKQGRCNTEERSDWIRGFQGKRMSVLYRDGPDGQGLRLDLREEDGGLTNGKEDLCQSAVFNMSKGQRSVIMESVGFILDKIVAEFLRSTGSTVQVNCDHRRGNEEQQPKCVSSENIPGKEEHIPQLEQYTSESEAEIACDSVVESRLVVEKATACRLKAMAMLEDQHRAVDKHQIHPAERNSEQSSSTQTQGGYSEESLRKTDEELQVASADYYTLEGENLWQDNIGPVIEPADSAMKHRRKQGRNGDDTSQDDYSNFLMPIKLEAGQTDANRMVIPFSEIQAITAMCGRNGSRKEFVNKIEEDARTVPVETNFFTSLANLTDHLHSSIMSSCEVKTRLGHCRQRSAILKPHPMLSPDTLIRQQEMDLLWQEYDDRRKQDFVVEDTRQPKESYGRPVSASMKREEEVNQADSDTAMYAYKEVEEGIKRPIERGCWQFKGRRAVRRSFLCFCRAWKVFGLKQCLQSSKVND